MQNTKVVKTSLVVMGLTILGKFLAFFRDALIASNFGATYESDIYLFAIGFVYLLTTLSYGLTTTFIPLHTENLEKKNRKTSLNFVNNILNCYIIFTLIVIVLSIIFAKYIVLIFTPGFASQPDVFFNAIKITRIMLISLFFLSIQSVITGVVQAHNEFYAPAAMATCANIVYILYLFFFASKFGLTGFAWVTVFGFFVQLAINIPAYKRFGYKYKFYINLKDKSLLKMLVLMLPIVISTAVTPINMFVNRFFASLTGEGAVSALDYSNKLNTLVDEVFAVSLAMVIYPLLSSLVSKDDKKEYGNLLIKSLNIVLMIMVPAALATALLRYPLINVIFRRGKFDDAAVHNTARALLLYTPAMIASGTRGILNKAYYSLQDTKTPMFNSIYGIMLNAILSMLLYKHLGVGGLTLSASISSIFVTIILLIKLKKVVISLDLTLLFSNLKKIYTSALVMGFAVYIINLYIPILLGKNNNVVSLIIVVLSFIFGVIIYFTIISVLKFEELDYFIEIIKKKLKKTNKV